MTEAVVQDWLKALESELGRIAFDELNPIEKLKQTVSAAEGSLAKLKAYVVANPFSSDREEIEFFKRVKPQFYCWKIYAFERYSVESWIPRDKEESKRNFLMGELRAVERFFRLHDFHYQYYKMEASELDELFFLRSNAQDGSILVPNVADPDPSFATKGDYLFAKFMALEKLASWIQQQLLGLDGLAPATMGQVGTKRLKWTGESINLLEVAYGLYYTGQLNEGKANIIDIVKVLEEVFGVNLGRPYRRLAEIRQRKRLSRTKFIEEMGVVFNKKLDDENEFRPYQ
ncbi:RteC domain-containing protein [Pedobacter ureilyticus]|uniref:RteC domain-containing protein n=1 Tax=Pedobacter ureilyticus TaxID=1393051 RepID=A0ABW9JAD4_9SPHI|nr:RteC domain-containing protein [Pedobacter helvus]